jgi:DNA polymerase-3 subunit chi
VSEVLFYRLSETALDAALPDLLERSLARGWRVLVRVGAEAALAHLDDRLWTWRDDAFLPHGVTAGPSPERQPVLLTRGRDNLNGADVLMLVLGARSDPAEMAGFARACLVFEAADAAAVEAAREDWRAVTTAGLPATYWAQQDGRWVRQATG